jgi:hypothetical protein
LEEEFKKIVDWDEILNGQASRHEVKKESSSRGQNSDQVNMD